jgi:predicted permease
MIWLESIFNDLRYALRMMRRAPLVTSIAALSLALGIGANTAIFTVLDALLLKLLPVKDPRQIVMLYWTAKDQVRPDDSFSFPMFERFRQHSGVIGFTDIDDRTVVAGGHADSGRGEVVSGNYYAVLGVAPILGRALTEEDDRDSAEPVCVISYRYWESRFGRDPSIVGQRIVVGGVPFTLVGVEPKGFYGLIPGYAPAFRVPIHLLVRVSSRQLTNAVFLDASSNWVRIAARVSRATQAQAAAELNVTFHQSMPPGQRPRTVLLGPGGEGLNWIRDGFREPLLVLMAAVGLVLLIACANVANLLLARAQSREKETSMRLALGAGAGRLIRQFLTESLLLAALGGTLGILLAYRAGDLLARSFRFLTLDASPDLRVLTFTAAVSLLTGILFGLVPAIRAARVDLRDTRSRSGFAHALVVAQLALSVVAVVGAGLYTRSLHNLRAIDLGMNIHNLTAFRLVPDASGYSRQQDADFANRVLARLETIPGVESVAFSRWTPMQGGGGVDIQTPGSLLHVTANLVTAHFFETMGVPVLLGRGLEERDRAGAPLVAVFNETLAHDLFPKESPVGRHFQVRKQNYEIIGVVRDSKVNGIRTAPPAFFASLPQSPSDFVAFTVEVRTVGNPSALAAAIRRAVSEVDANVPIFEMKTEEQAVDALLSQDRLFAGLSAIFGALALLLAAIGLYGVRAYAVARRTSEIGIRMALGADHAAITRMILRETAWLATFGVAIGLAAASGATRYIQSMLYGIAPRDFWTFADAALLLTAVAVLAGYLPARRAAQVDPMVALRHN